MNTPSNPIPVDAHPARISDAKQLAVRYGLPLATEHPPSEYCLYLTPQRLELHKPGDPSMGPAFVDFVEGRARHRRLYGGGKGQPLARAVGIKGGRLPKVLDATAGFGRDGFVLATLGCQVTMLERTAAFAALLEDALMRAAADEETAPIAARMRLVYLDAQIYLDNLAQHELPDTLYMDPMYPHRTKTSLVKKEMRIARDLAGDDADAATLLAQAQSMAISRVVVKRPRLGAPLGTSAPTAVVQSTNTRYDIYILPPR